MTDQRSPSDRRRKALALAGVSLAVLAVGLYAGRKIIAREALLGWLRGHGVTAEAEVDGFGFGGADGQVRIGDPHAPDFVAGEASVSYRLTLKGLEVRHVRLSRPILRGNLRDGKLSLGDLDPLIESFRRRPPQPDRAAPRIDIDHGLILLGTDAGPLRINADAALADGKLVTLDAVVAPTRLRGGELEVALDRAAINLRVEGARAQITADAVVNALSGEGVAARNARLKLTANAPYPDLKQQRGDGALNIQAVISATSAQAGAQSIRDAVISLRFDGEAAGWIPDLTVAGNGRAELRAIGLETSAAKLGVTRASLSATDLRWTRKGGDAVAATPEIDAVVQDLIAGGLHMRQVSTGLTGPMVWKHGHGFGAELAGGAGGRGAWTGLGAPISTDTPDMAAVKRAARGFAVAAPGLGLAFGDEGLEVALSKPARIKPDGGGEAVVTPRGDGVIWGPDGGAFRLTTSGGGLPRVTADLDDLGPSQGGIGARAAIKAGLSIGPMIGADVDAMGRLQIAGGQTAFIGTRCARVKAERLEFGVNDVLDLAGRFCPTTEPLLTLGAGDWRLHGRGEGISAAVPSFQVKVADAAGAVDFGLVKGALYADMTGLEGTLTDGAPQSRFNPIRVAGKATLARDVWTADIDGRTPGGVALGKARLHHVMSSGKGAMTVRTGTLSFAEGGLQPADLSPLALSIGSPAQGTADFEGRFDWTPGTVTSSGVLDLPSLDFQSPAGRVTGLSGKIAFTSLAPLITAPDQTLKADSVAAVAPLTGVRISLALDANALNVSGGEAQVGGGRVVVEKLTLPLLPGPKGASGVVRMEGVQLHDIVEASPFGPRMDLDAKVSGRIPFEVVSGKVRITGGDLRAIEPGRLTIEREAFTAPDAQGAIASATTPAVPATEAAGPFSDFAYQAMEDLAFDRLDAAISSQADGRMGVLFHIRGRHDPPTKQRIRLSVFDLITRKFMNRQLPLPSGTQVDLTLDTTLNLDDLLADYGEYQRLRNSRTVQP